MQTLLFFHLPGHIYVGFQNPLPWIVYLYHFPIFYLFCFHTSIRTTIFGNLVLSPIFLFSCTFLKSIKNIPVIYCSNYLFISIAWCNKFLCYIFFSKYIQSTCSALSMCNMLWSTVQNKTVLRLHIKHLQFSGRL